MICITFEKGLSTKTGAATTSEEGKKRNLSRKNSSLQRKERIGIPIFSREHTQIMEIDAKVTEQDAEVRLSPGPDSPPVPLPPLQLQPPSQVVETFRQVACGSTSAIKTAALRSQLPPSVQVIEVNAFSMVPPQPIGKSQTERGALNRAMGARERYPEADAWVGIENGMWSLSDYDQVSTDPGEAVPCLLPGNTDPVPCINCDGACVVLLVNSKHGLRHGDLVTWTETLPIPISRPFSEGRLGEWSELKDPHAVLTNGAKPRQKFLEDAIALLFRTLERLPVPSLYFNQDGGFVSSGSDEANSKSTVQHASATASHSDAPAHEDMPQISAAPTDLRTDGDQVSEQKNEQNTVQDEGGN